MAKKKKKIILPLEQVWLDIKADKAHPLCVAWTSFTSFCMWSHENGYVEGLVLKLKKGAKTYKPDTCYWEIQDENLYKKNALLIKYNGRTQSLMEWSRELDIEYHATYARLYKLGWPVKEAFEVNKLG